MVPLAPAAWLQRVDTLVQSADLNLRDLLTTADDPTALATYLWCLRRHRPSLVNLARLAEWGEAWVRAILIEGSVSPRQDEEIASAALAGVVLAGSPTLKPLHGEIRAGLGQALSNALVKDRIPFRRQAYAAMLLLAAITYGIDDPRLPDAVKSTVTSYMSLPPGGRFFGIGIVVALCHTAGDQAALQDLSRVIRQRIADAATDYEDRIYLAHALWLSAAGALPASADQQVIAEAAMSSPVWSYLMVGSEAVLPAAPPSEDAMLSPLLRAVLLDLVYRLEVHARRSSSSIFDGPYQRDRSVVWAAFAAYVLGLVTPSLLLLLRLIPATPAMYRYWILHDFRGVPPSAALSFMLGVSLLAYGAPVAALSIGRLWKLMIARSTVSDQAPVSIIWASARQFFKPWLIAIAVEVGFGIFDAFLYPALQNILGGR